MSILQKIKKRDGSVVRFDPEKIRTAISRAMVAVRGRVDRAKIDELTTLVLKELEALYADHHVPSTEGVQEIVEKTLMASGYFDVAKACILYHERIKKQHEERNDLLKHMDTQSLNVVKRDGTREPFNHMKLKSFIKHACIGYEGVVDVEDLTLQCELGIFDGITTEQILQLAIMTSRSLIEKDPIIYSAITSRLFLAKLYREVFACKFTEDNLAETYRASFIANLRTAVTEGKLDSRMLEFNLDRLAGILSLERDRLIPYRGLQILYDRYLLCSSDGKRRIETPQAFWMRVAMGLALNEGEEKEKRAAEFYEVLSTLRFVCSTPTLFHSGTTHPQLSSCYITTIDDSLESIFKSITYNAQISKWSGGIANDWSNIRGTGALIRSTNVESQGVIPFLKIANDVTVAINRSGKRRGATCAYLEVWHYDIEDFIELRRTTGDERRRTHDMNTAVWIPDLFMKRVISDGVWTLFSPDEAPDLHHCYGQEFEKRYLEYEKKAATGKMKLTKKVKAKELWRKILSALYETGHPWITFKDPCNIRSPQDHVGVVHSSNLCTEITLNTSSNEIAVCNLGSVNLAMHVHDGKLDVEMLGDTIMTAMRMLDNVIDLNYYPVDEARQSNIKHRPVGLGIMGWQDVLYKMNIRMDSEDAVKLADEVMEVIAYYAILASTQLAKERGPYQSFKGSKWDRGILPVDTIDILERERGLKIELSRSGKLDWTPVRQAIKEHGMRNSNCLAIAPTATISDIAGCFPSIEPAYSNLYVKSNMSGEFTIVNEYLVNDLKERGLWTPLILEELKFRDGSIQQIPGIPKELKDKYKTAFEISPEWLIKQAACRAKWIDQSQALTIFTNTTSGKVLSDIYIYAWSLGLKTTYYLRTLAASTIEKSTLDITLWKTYSKSQVAEITEAAQSVTPVEENSVCVVSNPECESCQ
jgi:ribonucleoside-diphosphate reductase alpha chain